MSTLCVLDLFLECGMQTISESEGKTKWLSQMWDIVLLNVFADWHMELVFTLAMTNLEQ